MIGGLTIVESEMIAAQLFGGPADKTWRTVHRLTTVLHVDGALYMKNGDEFVAVNPPQQESEDEPEQG